MIQDEVSRENDRAARGQEVLLHHRVHGQDGQDVRPEAHCRQGEWEWCYNFNATHRLSN